MRKHLEILAGRLAITHRLLLDAAEACTDDDLSWQPGPTSPSIAFHLWHSARWADRWAEAVGGAQQRWVREGLTASWGFQGALGAGDTEMLLPDDEAANLPFPRRDQLTTYLRGAYNDLEQAVGALDDDSMLALRDDLLGAKAPLADSLTRHLAHANRHLGMVEALQGLRGGPGTETV